MNRLTLIVQLWPKSIIIITNNKPEKSIRMITIGIFEKKIEQVKLIFVRNR